MFGIVSIVAGVDQVESVVTFAETLARITPGDLKKSFFTASGTEADETAVMMAQLYTAIFPQEREATCHS